MLATIAAIPVEDSITLSGLGTVAKLFGMATFAAWALTVFVTRRMRTPDTFHGLALALVAWVGLSLFWSLDKGTTLVRIETFLQLLALTVIAWDVLASDRAVRAALQAMSFGMWIAAASVYVNFSRGAESKYGRFGSFGPDPNYLAILLAIGMTLAWYQSMDTDRRALRVLNVLYVPVAAVALVLTGSRTGVVAIAVVAGYILSTVRRLRPASFVVLLLVIIGAVAAGSALVPETTLERIGSVGEEVTEGDLSGRAGIWFEARDEFLERPLVGVGAGASRAVLRGRVGHNVAITFGLELGIVGLALFAGMVISAMRFLRLLPQSYRRMWLAVLGIWAIGSLTMSLETRKLTFILFTLALAAGAASSHERTRRPAAALTTGPTGRG